jgi:23S rRNA (adenine2503-C2)-methyltransferase
LEIILNDSSSRDLARLLTPLGINAGQARRILAAAVRRSEFPPVGPGLSAEALATLQQNCRIPQVQLIERVESASDGFVRYLFSGEGEGRFEAVRIPLMHRAGDEKYVVCISCQVGCAMGCVFCATGKMGWTRDLAAWEMVDQVRAVADDSPHPVRGVVFMGMGEPLLNFGAVMGAAGILSEPCGMAISAKAITISTVGVIPGIRRFTELKRPYRLVVSLTSADPSRRAALLPVEQQNPTKDLIAALREYHAATGQLVILAWIMIAGVNTSERDARQLAELIAGLPIKIDLIDVNDPTGHFVPPSAEELNAFRDALRIHVGAPVSRRYSGGSDIAAACGMLAGRSTRHQSRKCE